MFGNCISTTVIMGSLDVKHWYTLAKSEDVYNKEPTAADHGDVLYTIGKSDTVGRYMVASRDIQPGEVIFTDQPAVIGPDNR